jgi:TM2 domain-containing membrane protein YozV
MFDCPTCWVPVALEREDEQMATILWILAAILVISGIVALLRGQMLWGIVLIVVGLLVGPGGVSIFT